MKYIKGADTPMLPKDKPIDRLYWVQQGKMARLNGRSRDHAYTRSLCLHKFNAWQDGWDQADYELLNTSGVERRQRAISRIERRKAMAVQASVQASVERALFPSAYEQATKGS